MSKESRLDEQVISQVAQAGLNSQLEEAESINVNVQTDVVKAAQGQADSISVSGQGMVMQDVRVQEMSVQTDRVAFNLLSVLLGKVELDKPLDAAAQMSLTEADLNRAMRAELVTSRIPSLALNVDGESVTVELVHPMTVNLPADGKIALNSEALLYERKQVRKVGFAVVIVPQTDEHSVLMESFVCRPGEGISIEFTIALMQKFKQLLELPFYEIEGMAFRVKKLDIKDGKMAIETEAHIPQIPSL